MAGAARPDSVLALTGFPPAVRNVPPNFSSGPAPGKISLLFNANSTNIYHNAATPWTLGANPFGIIPNKQPFVYRYPDEAQNSFFAKLPDTTKTLTNAVNITQDSIDDIYRISKFMLTSQGVLFNIKQLAIQRTAPFDETRLYNPLSPIEATVRPITLGLGDAPTRHIEGGILGLVNSITSTVGINFLGNTFQTPSSTVGSTALPTFNAGQGKGLVRGEDASSGYTRLTTIWQASNSSAGFLSGLLNTFAQSAIRFLGTTPKQPNGTQVRADEGTFTLMALSSRLMPNQLWYPTAKTRIDLPPQKNTLINQISTISSRVLNIISNPLSLAGDALNGLFSRGLTNGGTFSRVKIIITPNGPLYKLSSTGLTGNNINGRSTGYDIQDGYKYSNAVGFLPNAGIGDEFRNSDMTVQYSYYIQKNLDYPSKLSDLSSDRVKNINDNLKQVINKIGQSGVYQINLSQDTPLLHAGLSVAGEAGFNVINSTTDPNQGYSPRIRYKYGIGAQYFAEVGPGPVNFKDTKPIDNIFSTKNLRFATSFASDGINLLPVLKGNKSIPNSFALQNMYPGWTEWNPERDDLIAFYFYDVVNNKYIPFRATVKGISEGNTAYWDELRFIGRADQLYSYNGFSRTLSFTFNVVISSITELLPTYKKLNYMGGVVKPSNYTKSDTFGGRFSQFIVPPMFMVTIGDLYKFQPMVITSLNINIPDDASWETQNELNTEKGWSYLNGIIKSPGTNYAQLPREFEIAVTANLLEKERPIVGSAHFGHAPHTDDYVDGKFLPADGTPAREFLPSPTEFAKKMVEYTIIGEDDNKSTAPVNKGSAPTNNRNINPNDSSAPSANTSPVSTPTTTATSLGRSGAVGNTARAIQGIPFTVPGTSVTGIDFSR
jgi:hypothetical protein